MTRVARGPLRRGGSYADAIGRVCRRWWLLWPLLLAATLRFASLDFGQGVVAAHPDERNTIKALRATRAGKISYTHVAYGGGYVYPLAGFVQAVERTLGFERLGGGSPPDAAGRPFGAYVAARGWSGLLSSAAVVVTGVVGARVSGTGTGLVAALLLAASPVAVRDAHFAKADSACTLAVALLLLALTANPANTRRFVVMLGLTGGLAASVKYHVGPLLGVAVALLAADGTSPGARRRRILGFIAVFAAVVLGLNSFWLWAPRGGEFFTRLVRSQYEYVQDPWFDGLRANPALYHAETSLRHGFGLPMALLALPAVGAALWQGGRQRLIAITLLGQGLLLLLNPLTLSRNFLPLAPGLAILVAHLASGVVRTLVPARRSFALALTAIVLVAEPLTQAVRMAWLFGRADTRVLAHRWLSEHAAPGAKITIFGAPPDARQYGFGNGELRADASADTADRSTRQPAPGSYSVWHAYPIPYSSEPLPPSLRQRAPVVVFDPFSGPTDGAVFEPYDAFYLPLAGFGGIARPGPRIEIRAGGEIPPDCVGRCASTATWSGDSLRVPRRRK